MFTKRSPRLAILILTLVLLLSACTGAQPSPVTSEAVPAATQAPATAAPTEEPPTAAPTKEPSTVTPTAEPPTATPTEEPIELNPSPRGYVSMAYDTESKQVILFGGQTGDSDFPENFSDETWAFDVTAQTWTEMRPATAPSPRVTDGTIAYDAESDRVILFGGALVYDTYEDTWAYDYNTNTWTEMNALGPADHLAPGISYDAESDRVVIFGGFNIAREEDYQDIWAYDYNSDTWSELKPSLSPPAQSSHAMYYIPGEDRIISWGGDTSPKDNSVWVYDYNSNTWEQKVTENGPDARAYHAMDYSDNANLAFMYGGKGTGSKDMWVYDHSTNTWTMLVEPSTFPGVLSRFAMVYVPDIDRFVVYGGQMGSSSFNFTNQTWLYDLNTNTWTDVTRVP